MIRIEHAKKDYRTDKKSFFALDDVNLEIREGEFVAITGKSGSGKSTLLNMVGALDRLTEGSVYVDGSDLSKLSGRKVAAYRNKTVGFVFQSFYLEPSYTVYDNVELPLILAGRPRKRNRAKVEAALDEVGLADKIKEKARNLSGGEQQRVAIARAIVNDPKYILADEPCGNLDTANSENIMRILKGLHVQGKTVIMVTHDPEDALQAERIVTMSDGKVIGDTMPVGKPSDSASDIVEGPVEIPEEIPQTSKEISHKAHRRTSRFFRKTEEETIEDSEAPPADPGNVVEQATDEGEDIVEPEEVFPAGEDVVEPVREDGDLPEIEYEQEDMGDDVVEQAVDESDDIVEEYRDGDEAI